MEIPEAPNRGHARKRERGRREKTVRRKIIENKPAICIPTMQGSNKVEVKVEVHN